MSQTRVTRRNLITDVSGICVGNAEDPRARTGVTVIVPQTPAVAAVSVVGGAPGTRETDLLDPACLVDRVDAVVLAGGSAFGLEAAGGVCAALGARGRGFRIGDVRVPIVPATILFDLHNGGDKDWGTMPPYRQLGMTALDNAGTEFVLGNAGAGFGARAGRLKGGLGSASWATGDGIEIGALAAVNCFGSVLIPGTRHFWAGGLEREGEFGGLGTPAFLPPYDPEPDIAKPAFAAANTTLAVVATNAALTKAEAMRIAIMAQDGLARAIRPVHTPYDGDSVFVLATGQHACKRSVDLLRIGSLAADCLARAIARGVYEAQDLGDIRAYRSPQAK